MKLKTIWIVCAVVAVGGLSITLLPNLKNNTTHLIYSSLEGASAIVYKSPTCGCCEGHAKAMEKAGIEVKIVENIDLVSLKDEKHIPMDMQSCHTTILSKDDAEYVLEGHVPIEGIVTLLEQQPNIDGIALPGMPIGTPGMPGIKVAPYEIMTLDSSSNEAPKLYLSI